MDATLQIGLVVDSMVRLSIAAWCWHVQGGLFLGGYVAESLDLLFDMGAFRKWGYSNVKMVKNGTSENEMDDYGVFFESWRMSKSL